MSTPNVHFKVESITQVTLCLMNVQMKLLQPIQLFQHCLKTNAPKQGRLLGLDVGVKYVGLAVSDPHNRTAAPLWYENT